MTGNNAVFSRAEATPQNRERALAFTSRSSYRSHGKANGVMARSRDGPMLLPHGMTGSIANLGNTKYQLIQLVKCIIPRLVVYELSING